MTTTLPSSQTSPAANGNIDQLCINAIRTLGMDAVQQANSGHPGTVMGIAPVAYTLWNNHLNYDPAGPIWPNRDRFVLSAGHASMLLYALLHLTGVKDVTREYTVSDKPALTLDDLKHFRQVDSKTPGHPEYRHTSGIECTTGPLGQGLAMSVGMAISERWLAATYNKPGYDLFNYSIYSLCGDGCMMEGVSSEAASLAAHLKLSNLCWIYDSNRITIEGKTDIAFTENVEARFKAYGWHTIQVPDANDTAEIEKALSQFKQNKEKPTLIIVHSHIGYGSSHQDSKSAHGEALGVDVVKATKKFYGWPEEPTFFIPDGVKEHFQAGIGKRGAAAHKAWVDTFNKYKNEYAGLASDLELMQRRELPQDWDKDLPTFPADKKGLATRESSGKVINAVAKTVPWLIGGAADLDPSTKTRLTFEGAGDFQADNYTGRNFHFGVREFAMGAAVNGMVLSKIRAFEAGFFIFTDYGRPALRLAAIMEIPVIGIFTHDSIGVGEDGPTHEPIEQLMSFRAMPHMTVIRPGDANEVTEAWRVVMNMKHGPAILALSRQAMQTLDRTIYKPASGLAKGAYVLACNAPDGKPDVILIGTGTELTLCVDAFEILKKENVKARLVSMPSWELFEKQGPEYKEKVLPNASRARVAVEAGSATGWERYVGLDGETVGMTSFGSSGPVKDVMKKFHFDVDHVLAAARRQLAKKA